MRRFPLALVLLLLLAPLAHAQEDYTISANANQVADLTWIVSVENTKTCITWGLPAGCTQAAACTAANASGGASCTAAQARAAQARIFPLTQAGRQEFVIFKIAAPQFQTMRVEANNFGRQAYCAWFNAQTQGVRDGVCTAIGLPAGCSCPAQ